MYTPYSSLLRWSLLSILAIPTFSHSVSAQTAASRDSLFSEQALGGVVVTGTRTPKLLKNTPVQTRVITAEDIRRAAPADLPALLQEELPGVEFSFAMNQQPNLNLAGFAGQSVLILVDGERLAGETMDNRLCPLWFQCHGRCNQHHHPCAQGFARWQSQCAGRGTRFPTLCCQPVV